MNPNDTPIANLLLVLREEFDDGAVFFDPDTGNGFGLNSVSVFVFNRLDGKHTLKDSYDELCQSCDDVPENAKKDIEEFVNVLFKKGVLQQNLWVTDKG